MPYVTRGKCIYKKDGGAKVGCTKGSVKKYLAALHANVNESRYPGIVRKLKIGDRVIVNGWYGEEGPDPYDIVTKFDNEIGTVVDVDIASGLSFRNGGEVIISFDRWRFPVLSVGDSSSFGDDDSFGGECRGNRCMQFSNLLDDDYDFSIKPLSKSMDVKDFDAFETLYESEEDELEWARDTISDLSNLLTFNGKELFIDIRGFTAEENEDLREILEPYIDPSRRDMGDWSNDCLSNLERGYKAIALHCGIDDNDYEPSAGYVCCMNNTFEEEIEANKSHIIPIDGRLLLSLKFNNINESEEDEFEWAKDIISEPIKGVIEGQYYRCDGHLASEPFSHTLDIFVKKIEGEKVVFDSLSNAPDLEERESDTELNQTMTMSKALKLVDTNYWVPIKKENTLFDGNLNEAEEDDLGWAQDIVNEIEYPTSLIGKAWTLTLPGPKEDFIEAQKWALKQGFNWGGYYGLLSPKEYRYYDKIYELGSIFHDNIKNKTLTYGGNDVNLTETIRIAKKSSKEDLLYVFRWKDGEAMFSEIIPLKDRINESEDDLGWVETETNLRGIHFVFDPPIDNSDDYRNFVKTLSELDPTIRWVGFLENHGFLKDHPPKSIKHFTGDSDTMMQSSKSYTDAFVTFDGQLAMMRPWDSQEGYKVIRRYNRVNGWDFIKKNLNESEDLEWAQDAINSDFWIGFDNLEKGDYVIYKKGEAIMEPKDGGFWKVADFSTCSAYNPNDWSVIKTPCINLQSVKDDKGNRYFTGENIKVLNKEELVNTYINKFKIVDKTDWLRDRGWRVPLKDNWHLRADSINPEIKINESEDWFEDVVSTPINLVRTAVYFDNGLSVSEWRKFKELMRKDEIKPLTVMELDDMDHIMEVRDKHLLFIIDENKTVAFHNLDLTKKRMAQGQEYSNDPLWESDLSFDSVTKYFKTGIYRLINGYDLTGGSITESEDTDDLEWAREVISGLEDYELYNDDQELSPGTFLMFSGEWDNMNFEDQEAKVVRRGYDNTYLLVFPNIIERHEHTHCGGSDDRFESDEYDCHCEDSDGQYGRCWFVDLEQMNGVKIFPNRKGFLKESEEDELGWARDTISDLDAVAKIVDDGMIKHQLEGLPNGMFLKITGEQDGLSFDNQECRIIDNKGDIQGSEYLMVFPEEMESDNDHTHCGKVNSLHDHHFESKCHCSDKDDDRGRCWWVELEYMTEVDHYLNRQKFINESKEVLTEGRYDFITGKVVKDIMSIIRSTKDQNELLQINLPNSLRPEEYDYIQEGMAFSVELNVHHQQLLNRGAQKESETYFVHTAVDHDEDENVIMITVVVDPQHEPHIYKKLYYKLQEDIRHEIEHFTQKGYYRLPDRPISSTNTSELKTTYGHHKHKLEVPALVHGFYRRAKLERRPLDEVMMEDLDSEIEKGNLTKKQAKNLLNIWVAYSKKNLPSAIYTNN